jgi:hypothetical protein
MEDKRNRKHVGGEAHQRAGGKVPDDIVAQKRVGSKLVHGCCGARARSFHREVLCSASSCLERKERERENRSKHCDLVEGTVVISYGKRIRGLSSEGGDVLVLGKVAK